MTRRSTPLKVHRKRGLRVYSQASFSMDLEGRTRIVRKYFMLSAGVLLPSGERLGRTEPAGETAERPGDVR
jgi:hypothetical protein